MKTIPAKLQNLTATGFTLALSAGLGAMLFTTVSSAEPAISVYGGVNASPHSKIKYDFNQGAGPQSATVGWDGASFKMPPYYGVRATWWLDSAPAWGFGVDFSHSKVVASPLPAGFRKLEFTDGLNILTANLYYRYQNTTKFTPYGGFGIGVSIPHVEVTNTAGTSRAFEFQLGGIAVLGLVGVDYKINENWSVFGEVKSAFTRVDAKLTGGGSFSTNLISNQALFGVTYKF